MTKTDLYIGTEVYVPHNEGLRFEREGVSGDLNGNFTKTVLYLYFCSNETKCG